MKEETTSSGIILSTTGEVEPNDVFHPSGNNIMFAFPKIEKEKKVGGIIIQDNDQKELPNKITVLARGPECSDYIQVGSLLMIDIYQQSPVKLMLNGVYTECGAISEDHVFGRITKEGEE